MCKPISWLKFEKGKILYLTDKEIFNTKRGQELQDYCKNPIDLVGHGAIRWYYDITGGIEKEVSIFSSPANFPENIIKDFKSGDMKKMILNLDLLLDILSESTQAEYDKIQQSARAEYDKIKQSAWAEYEKIQ
ncbi:MAG: hypothetical protein Q8K02_18860, partial [Flavobacterium sp.]|nr:hypothetical protein [Flavobacterium sp.]